MPTAGQLSVWSAWRTPSCCTLQRYVSSSWASQALAHPPHRFSKTTSSIENIEEHKMIHMSDKELEHIGNHLKRFCSWRVARCWPWAHSFTNGTPGMGRKGNWASSLPRCHQNGSPQSICSKTVYLLELRYADTSNNGAGGNSPSTQHSR